MAVSLMKAIKEYFAPIGLHELKELTEEDKDDFVAMFAAVGIEAERKVALAEK